MDYESHHATLPQPHRGGRSRRGAGHGSGACILGVVVWGPSRRRDAPRGACGGRSGQRIPRSVRAALGERGPVGDAGRPARRGLQGGPSSPRLRDVFATARPCSASPLPPLSEEVPAVVQRCLSVWVDGRASERASEWVSVNVCERGEARAPEGQSAAPSCRCPPRGPSARPERRIRRPGACGDKGSDRAPRPQPSSLTLLRPGTAPSPPAGPRPTAPLDVPGALAGPPPAAAAGPALRPPGVERAGSRGPRLPEPPRSPPPPRGAATPLPGLAGRDNGLWL